MSKESKKLLTLTSGSEVFFKYLESLVNLFLPEGTNLLAWIITYNQDEITVLIISSSTLLLKQRTLLLISPQI